ncbi:MAG: lysine--tRNA ligase [candidate division Zixibacteria bacterium RBG_16_40_9]|nr:MAG: lysine--tRNA ligase [candidate division Zixibacteria bacterium RBG_16_40_9]
MEELSELLKIRREKLAKLKEKKINPYPYGFKRSHLSSEIIQNFDTLAQSSQTVQIAGRIVALRYHGKSLFFHLLDNNGKIQVYVKADEIGAEKYTLLDLYDMGDIVGVTGIVFKTKTGEISVRASEVVMLSKSLRPLPEKWHGLQDKELRFRQRYLDLISTPGVKEIFIKRAKITKAIRNFLDEKGFVEVETPILQPIYGGASARPFKTYHNALGTDLYLRIADELYLKRLIVGGIEKVYEFCKDFRNEGMDRNHNPEFTMVELYLAYADYNDIMELTENLIVSVAKEAWGSSSITYQGNKIDLSPPWRRVSLCESIKEKIGKDLSQKSSSEIFELACDLNLNAKLDKNNRSKLIEAIFEEKVQPTLIQPTFIIDYPVEMSPLAKRHRSNPDLTERFEAFIGTGEVGNAFSELNDPLDQKERFEQQMKLRALGDEEAQVMDEDFLKALEHGMPPCGGLGIGIDRLTMLLTDCSSIREVILFPQMKPETDVS